MKSGRILYVFHGAIDPPTVGMHQRNKLLYRALCELGHVDTICLREQHEFVSDDQLEQMRNTCNLIDVFDLPERGQRPPWAALRPLAPRQVDRAARAFGCPDVENQAAPELRDRLQQHLRERGYDLVVGRYLYRAAKAGVLDVHPNAVDVDDLQTELLRTTLETRRNTGLAGALQRRRLRRLQAKLPARLAQADTLFVANDEHRREPGLANAIYLPNIPYFEGADAPPPPPPIDPQSKTILFVGSFGHPPNVEGIEHFLARIWPGVHDAQPDATLMLVGSMMSEAMKHRYAQLPGVQPIGFVDNLRHAYARARFTIVPIYRGSGTNIKVPESLAYGRPTIVTPFALRGYRSILADADGCTVAANDAAFADACLAGLTAPAPAADAVHAAVADQLSYRSFAERVRKAFRSERQPRPALHAENV